jgi:DNA-binding NarL/FixJ family response regulator
MKALLVLAAWLCAAAEPGVLPARGTRVLVVQPPQLASQLQDLGTARGWKVEVASGWTAAVALARKSKPKLLLVSEAAVNRSQLQALRAASPGARVVVTTAASGDALGELQDALAPDGLLRTPFDEGAALEAISAAVGPRPALTDVEKAQREQERQGRLERRERARRIAALTLDRLLAMAEPLQGEEAAVEALLDRIRRKAATGPEVLSEAEQDLLLAHTLFGLGLTPFADGPEGDRANATVAALERIGFEAQARALEEAFLLLAGRGRIADAVDRIQARGHLQAAERQRWQELARVLGGGPEEADRRVEVARRLLEYARAQRRSLRLEARAAALPPR